MVLSILTTMVRLCDEANNELTKTPAQVVPQDNLYYHT